MLSFTRYADDTTISPLRHLCISTLDLCNQVAIFYRSKLRDDPQGVEGLRRRVEHFVNLKRPSDVMVSTFP